MLGVLVGDIPGRHDTALKLFHPLLRQFCSHLPEKHFHRTTLNDTVVDRAIRFCFHLLEEDLDTTGEDQVRSRNLAFLIHIFVKYESIFWVTRNSFTAAEFDLLVDYHLHICEGTNYNLIEDTFSMLAYSPPNTLSSERMRHYTDSIIRFMGEETTCFSALDAAMAMKIEIVSMA